MIKNDRLSSATLLNWHLWLDRLNILLGFSDPITQQSWPAQLIRPKLHLSRRQFLSVASMAMDSVIFDQLSGDPAQAANLPGTEYLVELDKSDFTDPAMGQGMQGAPTHNRVCIRTLC